MKARHLVILVLILGVSKTALAEPPIICANQHYSCVFNCGSAPGADLCRVGCAQRWCAFEQPVPFPVFVEDPAVIDPVPLPEQPIPVTLPPPNPGAEQAKAKFLERECRAGYTLSCIRLNGISSLGRRQDARFVSMAEMSCRQGNNFGCETLGKLVSEEARGGPRNDRQLNRLLERNATRLCQEFNDTQACNQIPLLQDPNWAKGPGNFENLADNCRRHQRACDLVGSAVVQ